jgi:hypothetical protein
MELADEEAADFIPTASDASLDFESRIGVCQPAAIGADIVGSERRHWNDARRRCEAEHTSKDGLRNRL